MALHHLAEAVLRLEFKVDLIMKFLGMPPAMPMHFIGQMCPACSKSVDYQIDVNHQVVIRKCDCKSGKIPSTYPLLPAQGATSGQASTQASPGAVGDFDPAASGSGRSRSKGR